MTLIDLKEIIIEKISFALISLQVKTDILSLRKVGGKVTKIMYAGGGTGKNLVVAQKRFT